MDFSRPQVEYGMDILISDGIIKEIGKNLKAPKDTKIVNAKDKYVIPGLINCHTHVSMSYFKEITEGLKLQD
jgi:5-methylthioadenosine/S-adenosylhomocysteine deaminase